MISSEELADQYGTPLYVYDLDEVSAAIAELSGSLPSGVRVYYSLKANPHPQIVQRLAEAGCGAEISSVIELDTALAAGMAGEGCLYTGPGKTRDELNHAASRGVGLFSVESVADAARINAAHVQHQTRARCLVRVNGTGPAGGAGLRMSGVASQFGIDLADVPSALERISSLPACDVVGLHHYEHSNAATEDALLAELVAATKTAASLSRMVQLPIQVLDLGGGFSAPFAQPGRRATYPNLRNRLESTLDEHFPLWRQGKPEVAVESGRYLAGTCGTLVTRVMDVKQSKGTTFVVLDAGINHLGGMSGLRRMLPTAAQPAVHVDPERPRAEVRVVGPLCTPADILAINAIMPTPREGDVVTIDNVGAYGPTASLLSFLSRPAPQELVFQDGRLIAGNRLEVERTPLSEPMSDDALGSAMSTRIGAEKI